MLRIKLVRLQLRLQLKILPLGNAAPQARVSYLKPPASVRGSHSEPVSHELPKNTTKNGIDRSFQYFMPRTEKAEKGAEVLI